LDQNKAQKVAFRVKVRVLEMNLLKEANQQHPLRKVLTRV